MLSCEYCKIFKSTYFEKHLPTTVSRNARTQCFLYLSQCVRRSNNVFDAWQWNFFDLTFLLKKDNITNVFFCYILWNLFGIVFYGRKYLASADNSPSHSMWIRMAHLLFFLFSEHYAFLDNWMAVKIIFSYSISSNIFIIVSLLFNYIFIILIFLFRKRDANFWLWIFSHSEILFPNNETCTCIYVTVVR